jgi:hypothetical protein
MKPGMLVTGAFAAPCAIGRALPRRVVGARRLHAGCTPDVALCRRMRGGLPAREIAS